MKKNLKSKTNYFFAVLFLCLFQTLSLTGQTISEWRSAASGDFAVGATWEKLVLGVWTLQTGTSAPSGSSKVTIRSGHTVTIAATKSVYSLTIEANGKFASTAAITAPITFRVGASSTADVTAGFINNEVVIQNDGILGSLTDTDAGINLEVAKDCKTLTLQGSGTCRIGRTRFLYPNANSPATFNIDQNMYLGLAGSGSFTAYYNNAANTATENNVINLKAGKTVTLAAGGSFHGGVSSTAPPVNAQGTMTYNIEGTLDLSATSSGGLQTSSQTAATTAGPAILNLNIKSGGLMKLGTSFAAYRGANSGSINMVIENGGVVDGTLLTGGITNNSSTLNTGYTWFVTQGTGYLKQTVGSTSTTFPVGPTATSYNPVTLNNGGGQTYSVGVKTGNTPPGVPNVAKALNRTWGILPSAGGPVDMNFGYNTGEGNASCVLTDPMQLQYFNGAAWASLGSATPSVPSSGSTGFQVGYSGISGFAIFNLVNSAAIPVELMTFKANAKGTVNVLDWATATERNNREFVIERSTNGIDFQQIGSVKGNGNATVVHNYTFIDKLTPLPILSGSSISITAYYRLRQVDFDGKETVSKTVAVAREGQGKVNINKIYPSVTSDYLTVDMTANGATALTITDMLGRVVRTQSLGDNNGSILHRLDVSTLASGLYFVTLQSDGVRMTEKFEKK